MAKCLECENIYDRKKGVIVSKCGARHNKPKPVVEVKTEKKVLNKSQSFVRASPIKDYKSVFDYEQENKILPEEVNEDE
jgi:hypothetical protein